MFRFFFVFGIVLLTVYSTAAKFDYKKILNFNEPGSQEFSSLVEKFRFKIRNEKELTQRLSNFQKSKKNILRFSKDFKGATFETNEFSLMSDDELKQFVGLPLVPQESEIRTKRSVYDHSFDETYPSSYDFRDYQKVTPVKRQGGCGACWAFATTAAIESQFLIHANETLDLSEQYLVDCDEQQLGCSGGYFTTYNFIKSNGIPNESCVPYTATEGTCSSNCADEKYSIGGFLDFGKNESNFAKFVYNFGPATIGFLVPQALFSYKSGVLEAPFSICNSTNAVGGHAVTIVGYTDDYFVAKNSMGTNWGDQGYFKFKRNQNFCGFTSIGHPIGAPFLPSNTPPTVPTTPKPTTAPWPTECIVGDGITDMDEAARNLAVEFVNSKRSQIAKGNWTTRSGEKAPSAKNMPKIVYDCSLENQLLETSYWSCSPKSVYPYLYPIFERGMAGNAGDLVRQIIGNDTGYWSFDTILNSTTNRIDKKNSFDYQLASDTFSRMACMIPRPGCYHRIVCAFGPMPELNDKSLYFPGHPCTVDSHCTTPGFNKCDAALGLCEVDGSSPTSNSPVSTTITTPVPPPTTTTQPPPFTPLNCSGAMDLVFVIDASDTMTSDRFTVIKSQLLNAISRNNIKLENDTARIGIVLSTGQGPGELTIPFRYFDFKACQSTYYQNCRQRIPTTLGLRSAVRSMPYDGGINDIALTMKATLEGDNDAGFGERLFGGSDDRQNVQNAMIVITGPDTSNVTQISNQLKASGVQVFSIGFFDTPVSHLEAISGNPSAAFSTYPENVANVIEQICTGINPWD